MKKIYNFPEKSELPKSIILVKISWLIFSAVSGVEMKNLQRSEQTFLSSGFAALFRASSYAARACSPV